MINLNKIAFICLLLTLVNFHTEAQITLTNAHFPDDGDAYLYIANNNLIAEDFAATGAGYAWDFSMGTMAGYDTIINIAVSSTPTAYQFYFNNPILYPSHNADYAVAGEDLEFQGQVSIEDRFDYLKTENSTIQLVGFGARINGLPASVKYDTIDQLYPLPLTYAVNDSTPAYYIATVPNLGTYGQHIQRKVECDGYGSLTTPEGVYNNTLRIKTTIYSIDTLYVDQFSFGITVNRPVEVLYEWRDEDHTEPIMAVRSNGGQTSEVKYLSGSSLSVMSSVDNSSYQLSYNHDEIMVKELEDGLKTLLIDVNGKVKESNYSGSFNVAHLASGIYFIAIVKDNNLVQTIKWMK